MHNSFDSYYDAPECPGDALYNMTETLLDGIKFYPIEDETVYEDEYRKESCLLESIAMLLIESGVTSEVLNHVRWLQAGKPQRTNVYDEAKDLMEVE